MRLDLKGVMWITKFSFHSIPILKLILIHNRYNNYMIWNNNSKYSIYIKYAKNIAPIRSAFIGDPASPSMNFRAGKKRLMLTSVTGKSEMAPAHKLNTFWIIRDHIQHSLAAHPSTLKTVANGSTPDYPWERGIILLYAMRPFHVNFSP